MHTAMLCCVLVPLYYFSMCLLTYILHAKLLSCLWSGSEGHGKIDQYQITTVKSVYNDHL